VEDNGHPEHFSVMRGSLVETADLSHNAISDLGPLKHHRRLTSLSLSYNKLTSLAAMPPLARLQVGCRAHTGSWLCAHAWLCVHCRWAVGHTRGHGCVRMRGCVCTAGGLLGTHGAMAVCACVAVCALQVGCWARTGPWLCAHAWLCLHCGKLFVFNHYHLGMSVGESGRFIHLQSLWA
jgi:hypothetical protein